MNADGDEPGWKELYLLGGISAIVLVAVMMLSVGLFIVWPDAPGITATVDMFTLVQENRLAGLPALDLGVSLSNLVSIPLYLALYVALRQITGCLHRHGGKRHQPWFFVAADRRLLCLSVDADSGGLVHSACANILAAWAVFMMMTSGAYPWRRCVVRESSIKTIGLQGPCAAG